MMFAAMSSAYIVLSAGGQSQQRVAMPRMFYLSTAIILTSSASFELAKRSLKTGNESRYLRWLRLTLLLGLAFLAAQFWGWRELKAQGVYFAGHPHSSFFYLFTGVHGVHLIGGITALTYLLSRARLKIERQREQKTAAYAAMISLYWHMMDALWIWLFALLVLWG
jgi:cytochrome c oxidase subunit 3